MADFNIIVQFGKDVVAGGSITADKLADKAVITAKLDDNAVTEGKILNGAVIPEKLSQAYFTTTEGEALQLSVDTQVQALQLSVDTLAQDLLNENSSRLEAERVLLESIVSLVEALGESAREIEILKQDITGLQKQLD
jgi:hypothetical protein